MVEIFRFPETRFRLPLPARHTARFPATAIDVARDLLAAKFPDACLEQLSNGKMAVDHEGKMVAIFSSPDAALAFTAAMSLAGVPL